MSENNYYAAAESKERPLDPNMVRMTAQATWEHAVDGAHILNRRYLRGKRVGLGQHGAVYLAFDLEDNDRQVAIKIVKRNNPREEKQKLLRQRPLPTSNDHVPLSARLGSQETKIKKEIAIMKKCRHSHVVRLIEVIDDKLSKRIYMVMEYLGGGELKWKNSQDEPVLTVFQARRICRDVMLGLEYLHYQGIIHRDIKPANIVWDTKRSMVKITDFGVSHFSYAQRLSGKLKSDDDDPDDPILLDDSDLAKRAGTPFYLAPEVVQSDWDENTTADENYTPPPRPPITKAIDIWALGVTLYSLLFGRTPFTIPDDRPQHEFQIYRIICTEDWDVPETMGADRVPITGRHPSPDDEEGYPVVTLLDQLLQKDANRRITIHELKRNEWFVGGIAKPEQWRLETSPSKQLPVSVTDVETASALNPLTFNTWGRLTRRVSTFLRGVRRTHRQFASRPRRNTGESGAGLTTSEQSIHVTRQKSTTTRKPDKGKGPARPTSTGTESVPDLSARSKSADRWPAFKPKSGASSTTVIGPPRQGSGPSGSGEQQHRQNDNFRSFFSGMNIFRSNRRGPSVDTSPVSSRGGSNPSPISFAVPSHLDSFIRHSDDALRSRSRSRMSEQGNGLGSLTRRVSSWGDQGDHLEEPNLHSEDELSESVMLQGAGGVLDEPRTAADATTHQTPAQLRLHQSQADRLLNHSDIPSESPPAGPSDPRHHNARSMYASPLRQDPYSSDLSDDDLWGDDETSISYPQPGSSPEFQRDDDDDDDSDDDGIVLPRARPVPPRSTSPPTSPQA